MTCLLFVNGFANDCRQILYLFCIHVYVLVLDEVDDLTIY